MFPAIRRRVWEVGLRGLQRVTHERGGGAQAQGMMETCSLAGADEDARSAGEGI